MAPGSVVSDVEIDEDLHSRQLAVYGRETMRRMFGANVLVSGLKGLGVEVAKNVILAGVKSVTLHDTETVLLSDLSAQFYLTEADVGKNRAAACSARLQELNKAVAVHVETGEMSEELLGKFQVAVFTDLPLSDSIRFDAFCHAHNPPIAFIRTEIRGVFGSVFCDFGPSFTVVDTDGEEPHAGIVASVSSINGPGGEGESAPTTLVTCVDDERLEFEDGDLVVFSEICGMEQLNDGVPRRVRAVRPHSFVLEEDVSEWGLYSGGGIVTQVKQPKVCAFRPLGEALENPGEFLLSDFAKFDRPPMLHAAFRALDSFRKSESRFPRPANKADASRLIALAKEVAQGQETELDEELLAVFASGSSADLCPMAAMFGGIVGQEVVKACTGKFHPLFQFFYFDSAESLPPLSSLTPEEVAPLAAGAAKAGASSGRYDAQVAVFGRSVQRKLMDSRVFLVGAGALGCEFLKNFALMGIGCGGAGGGTQETSHGGSAVNGVERGKGLVTVTDDDVIEKSNLSRQFLFRDWDIGRPKSTVAAAAAKRINSGLVVDALQSRVNPESEGAAFGDTFWQEQVDVVVNALDNVKARLYVDSRCVYFGKPLLESGTLGTKCNTQMVQPHQTENYGASRDPPERQAPMCTLHSFPHNIDHCLTWARSEFEGWLEKTPGDVNAFLEQPAKVMEEAKDAGDAAAREGLERVKACLVQERCTTFEDCLAWARSKFQDHFYNRVSQLTFTFPRNSLTSSGTPFWSAPKRFPTALAFDPSDSSHLAFVTAGAILRAETFGIRRPEWAADPSKVAAAVAKVEVPEFKPKEGVRIETDEKATATSSSSGHSADDGEVIESLCQELGTVVKGLPPSFRMAPVQFEKDDDTNFHMDLITALANMRARNYGIPEVDKLKAKFIAGRIIPAIATTTALATGLVCLELYKIIQSLPAEKLRNTFANLALPLFSMAEPLPPKRVKHGGDSWSVWDRWIVEGDVTLQELLDYFEAKKLTAYSISCGAALLYNSMFPKHMERMGRKVSELAFEIAKIEVPEERSHFDVVVACEDEEDNDVDVPLVSIKFR